MKGSDESCSIVGNAVEERAIGFRHGSLRLAQLNKKPDVGRMIINSSSDLIESLLWKDVGCC